MYVCMHVSMNIYNVIIKVSISSKMTTTETDDTSTSASGSESNTATITEFQSLQQKSNELFDDLRHLPQIGQKVWQPYFGKAFTLFTKANNNCV